YFLPRAALAPLPERLHEAPDVCYLSAPYRGLEILLTLWPEVRRRVPAATLRCAYGWQVHDTIAFHEGGALTEQRRRIDRRFEELRDQGVQWLGRLPMRDVIGILDTSRVWAYPCVYPEMLSHVGQIAMARAAWPVIRPEAALRETVAGGRHVLDDLTGPAGVQAFADALAEELARPAADMDAPRRALREAALRRPEATDRAWAEVLAADGIG
ncbi:MAG: hypothetical protein AABY22_12870, partial [Nanoarchaeota archaeon]